MDENQNSTQDRQYQRSFGVDQIMSEAKHDCPECGAVLEDFSTPAIDTFHCPREGFWFKAEPKGGRLLLYSHDNVKVIRRKSWPEFFQPIKDGTKKFDIRLNESEIHEGDILVLREFRPDTQQYTGRTITKKITYISNTKEIKLWTIGEMNEKGLLILSLEKFDKIE